MQYDKGKIITVIGIFLSVGSLIGYILNICACPPVEFLITTIQIMENIIK